MRFVYGHTPLLSITYGGRWRQMPQSIAPIQQTSGLLKSKYQESLAIALTVDGKESSVSLISGLDIPPCADPEKNEAVDGY